MSYPDIDIKKNYKIERMLNNLAKPKIKLLYNMWDHSIMFGNHFIPVRIFLPKKRTRREIFIFFHGGGWVSGNIETYTKPCVNLANNTGCCVISVDYRLAPEFPYPNALLDCYFAVKEIYNNFKMFDTEKKDFILIGDSAGGNLTAAVSIMARDRGEFNISKQILIYPATFNNHTETSPFESVRANGYDYLLTAKKICDYMDLYIQDEKYRNDVYFAPLLSENLRDQPKTLVVTAEYDPLRDEGEAYGKKLAEFGNDAEIYRMKDALHGFFTLPARFVHVKQLYTVINTFLERTASIEH